MLPNLGALSLNAPQEAYDAVPTDVILDDWREAIRRHEDPEDDFRLPEGVGEDDDCAICMNPLRGRRDAHNSVDAPNNDAALRHHTPRYTFHQVWRAW